MSADAVESVACAQAPDSKFKVQRGVARQWLRAVSLPFAIVAGIIATKASCETCGDMAERKPDGDRWRRWLANAIWLAWIAAMLAIVFYAAFYGESAIAELDGLNLLEAYELVP